MRVIVLRTCCVAPPAANDWFWNVPRLEYTASALPPAFAGAQMAQAATIALADSQRPQGMAHLLRSAANTVPMSVWANGGVVQGD